MAIRQEQVREDQHERALADAPLRVIIAYNQLTPDEQGQVRAALQAIDHKEPSAHVGMRRLAGPDPLYALNATPDVTVIVNMEPGAPVEVMDIVRLETLRNFAHAVR
jgi:hypothetical protein